jgi:hypothetical protein
VVYKEKDLSRIKDWITLVGEDEEFKYYTINRGGQE